MTPSAETLRRRYTIAGAVLILLIGAGHLLTIRSGHGWGGDFALYLAHAQNLVEGRAYADTGYIVNPERSVLGPLTYPPVFPLLLTGPVSWFGIDLEVLKRFMVIPFVSFLFFYYSWSRTWMGDGLALVALLLVGTSPFLWDHKENITSDVPFLAFLFLALWLLNRLDDATGWQTAGLAVACGLTVYLAYGTRVIGMVAIPAIVSYDLLRFSRVRRRTWLLLSVTLAPVVCQMILVGTMAAYGDATGGGLFGDFPAALIRNLAGNILEIPKDLTTLWRMGVPWMFGRLGAVYIVLLSAGLALGAAWKKPSRADLFVVFYVGALAVFPFGTPRYLLPVFAILTAHLVCGIARLRRWTRRLLGGCAAVYLISSTIVGFGSASLDALPDGVHDPDAREMFDFVQRSLPNGEICVFRKPRALALLGGCSAVVYAEESDPGEMMAFFEEIGAGCFIAWKDRDDAAYSRFLRSRADGLAKVFENDSFVILTEPGAVP